jgi:hypothetical protein
LEEAKGEGRPGSAAITRQLLVIALAKLERTRLASLIVYVSY